MAWSSCAWSSLARVVLHVIQHQSCWRATRTSSHTPRLYSKTLQALVELPSFLPDLKAYSGRALQLPGSSWLGPCFSVSVLPDPLIKQAPDILAECFANPEQRRQVRAPAWGLSWGKREAGPDQRWEQPGGWRRTHSEVCGSRPVKRHGQL